MTDYWLRHSDKLLSAFTRHLWLTGWTLAISVLLAACITFALLRRPRLAKTVVTLLGAVYAIPSLALFALLIPVLGIGVKTAVAVLVAYNQFLLTRNFLAGFQSVDAALTEAAAGMGMSPLQTLRRVQLPLAAPAILAGIRLAVVSTIGIATIAAAINAGGLGDILFDGMRTRNTAKLLWGSALSAGLAVTANAILATVQHVLEKRRHP